MKNNIPFDKFVLYIKNSLNDCIVGGKDWIEKITTENAIFEEMEKIKWQDFVNLSIDEMKLIPAGYIYDWTIVNGLFDLQEKIPDLYSRYSLPMLSGNDYLKSIQDNKNKIFKIKIECIVK